MKLWEIKAQSLRIMFADTDIQFDEAEFSSETIYNNANTREKLIRMNDSIRRAIDTFYQFNGEITRTSTLSLILTNDVYENALDVSGIEDFGYPSRVDVLENLDAGIFSRQDIPFYFDRIGKKISFTRSNYTSLGADISFFVYYKASKVNLPEPVDEMTYDLNTLNIPEEVQRMIPFFVKGELYEEDEASIAKMASQKYIDFLMLNQRKNHSKVNTKVKSNFPWGSE